MVDHASCSMLMHARLASACFLSERPQLDGVSEIKCAKGRCACRGLCELRWMAWGDVSAAVRQLYLRRWPKLNLNVHLACSSCQAKRFQAKVPRDAMPDVALDWEEFRTVPASAWRVPAHTHRPCKQRRSAAKGMFRARRE